MKKVRVEIILYIYIMLLPIIDGLSNWLPSGGIIPLFLLRLIIPGILFLYIMIKDKESKHYLIIMGIVYMVYGFIHLFIFNKLSKDISYVDFIKESTFIINYTINIFMIYIMYYFHSKKKLVYLKESLFISLIIYLIIIYYSTITNTRILTYHEGIGLKTYFLSTGSLCTILLLMLSGLIKSLFDDKKWINYLIIIAIGVYLVFLAGSKTGSFGFILVMGMFILSSLVLKVIKKRKINLRKIIIFSVIFLAFVIGTSFKKQVVKEKQIIDINTGEISHVTIDTTYHVKDIKENVMSDKYLSHERQQALVSMYNKCNKIKLNFNNRKMQQLIYNSYKIKYEHNISYLLFGNGYLNDYNEMILEMEIPALALNFGILGLIFYLGPILFFLYSKTRMIIKNNRLFDLENMMLISGVTIALIIATLSGFIIVNTTCTLIITSLICLIDTRKIINKK